MNLKIKSIEAILLKAIAAFFTLLFNLLVVIFYRESIAADVLLIITAMILLSVFFRIGSDQFIVRFVGRRSKVTKNSLSTVGAVQHIVICITLFALGIIYIASLLYDFKNLSAYLCFILAITFYSLSQVNSFYLQSIGRPIASIYFLNLGFFIFLNLIHILVFWCLGKSSQFLTIDSFLIILLLSSALNYFISLLNVGFFIFKRISLKRMLKVIRLNLSYCLLTVMQMTLVWIPQIILYCSSFKSEVPSYTFLYRFSLFVGFVLLSISAVYTPAFAKDLKMKNFEKIERNSASFVRLSSFFGIISVIVLSYSIGYISTFFDKSQLIDLTIMWILFAGQLINVVTGPCQKLLIMGGQLTVIHKTQLFTLVLSLFLGIPLVFHCGILGAAVVTTLILLVTNFTYVFYTFRIFNINVYRYIFS